MRLKIEFNFGFLWTWLLMFCVLSSYSQEEMPKVYRQSSTVEKTLDTTGSTIVVYKDSLSPEPICLRISDRNIPLHYFKNINAEVCFDKECRLLDIILYWNITGRYLGFELPKGEFLSKFEHEPFNEEEYQRLNELLSDASLPFWNISFDQLIARKESQSEEVDGVSGATNPNIAEMVVKGAAYTTFKLWNLLYGPTYDRISHITEQLLTPDLISLILQSPDISDRTWALDRITPKIEINGELQTSLLNIISGDDYFMAYSAINAILRVHLNSTPLQLGLFSAYQTESHSIRKMILQKLLEAPFLSPEIVSLSKSLLSELNGQQLEDFLNLYRHHQIKDVETLREIAKILDNKNKYISKKAYHYLLDLNSNDTVILKHLRDYKEKI
jgi:WD40 repeat protein